MKPFIQDGHILALRAIRATLDGTETRMIVEAIETSEWASATFMGTRHCCEVRLEGAEDALGRAVERLVRDLPEADVAPTTFFLADAAVTGFAIELDGDASRATVTVEALTLEA